MVATIGRQAIADLISHRDACVLCLVGATGEALGWPEGLVIVPEHC